MGRLLTSLLISIGMRLVQSVLDFPTHAHSQSLVHAISFGIDDHLEALWQAPGGLTKPRLKTQPAELGFSLFEGPADGGPSLRAAARNRKQNKTREFVVWARDCNTKPELNDFRGSCVECCRQARSP